MDILQIFKTPGNNLVFLRENVVYLGTNLPKNYKVLASELETLEPLKAIILEQYEIEVTQINYQKGKAVIGTEGERLIINQNEKIVNIDVMTVQIKSAWDAFAAEVEEKAELIPLPPRRTV